MSRPALVGVLAAGAAFLPTAPAQAQLSFGAPVPFAGGASPWLLAAGDVNSDRRADLAVANISGWGEHAVTVLVNESSEPGRPAFGAPAGFDGQFAQAVALADLDGDGRPELIAADQPGSSRGRVTVRLNATPAGSATPRFGEALSRQVGNTPEILAVADMDGDRRPDMVTANFGTFGPDAVTVLRNTTTAPGEVSFAPAKHFDGGAGAEGMALGDLNGDGKPDVVTGNTAGNDITALVNESPAGSGEVRLGAPQHFPGEEGPTAVTTADLNRDGRLDVAVGASFTNLDDANALTVLLNETSPGSSSLRFGTQTVAVDPGIEGIAAADFDGDGRQDLATAAYRSGLTGVASVLRNTTDDGAGRASFEGPVRIPIGSGTVAVVAEDFDGDRAPDLAMGSFLMSGRGGVVVARNETPQVVVADELGARARCFARRVGRSRHRVACDVAFRGAAAGPLTARLLRGARTLGRSRSRVADGRARIRFALSRRPARSATLAMEVPTAQGREAIAVRVRIRRG